MLYKPLADRVTVKEAVENMVTPGGLVIPSVARRNKHLAFGTVLAVGSGRVNAEGKTVPLTVKPGDLVAFPRKLPASIPLMDEDGNEEEILLMRESEIIAIVEGLPVATHIAGVDGRLISMVPTSRGLPDSVYENRDSLDQAERLGFGDGPCLDEGEPGWTP